VNPGERRDYVETVTVREHLEALAKITASFESALKIAEEKLHQERDRRYTEVNIEKEKALKIKETADLAALSLARDIQIYKDEKANELREQINSERGLYSSKADLLNATEKVEAMIKPLSAWIQSQQGSNQTQQSSKQGTKDIWGFAIGISGVAVAIIAVILATVRHNFVSP
jgi:hypothetical protein